jgi:energy-coupling factor transporter ATP-binding protein EcfA2
MNLPADLAFLSATLGVKALVIRPPFICSTSENTRTGTFFDQDKRLQKENYKPEDYRAICLLIKGRIGYVFVQVRFLSFLVSLGNLFQVVRFEDYEKQKPDFIVVFGADLPEENGKLSYYYKDEDVYVGLCPLKGHIDYFGYMKKIILTLHNLKMIDEGKLPIHGAGIEVSLKNGKTFNIVILGDSGAGKSETIEAVKGIGQKDVASIQTIFDDMGTFQLRDNQVMTNGTEIGAFVRLDDLDKGYSLKSVDRAIYINIDSVNSRVVIPIETYEMSKDLHKVDMFLLADNFTPDERGLVRFESKQEAEKEFIKGQRMAKGTTSEKGLVTSFFANPFGPVQREADCQKLIDMFFDKLFEENVYVGKLYTKLALDPSHGPENGAEALLRLIDKLD